MQRLMILAPLAMFFAIAQSSPQNPPSTVPELPNAFIQRFYRQVVAVHGPAGLPTGADWEILKPLLSKKMIRSIDLTRSCQEDWLEKNHGRMIKAPFAWGEAGLFSGPDDSTAPFAFHIDKTESKEDGSSLVYVSLQAGNPTEKPWTWEIAAKVVQESGHLVVDDIIHLKGQDGINKYRLSEILREGCDGPHWVGFHDRP